MGERQASGGGEPGAERPDEDAEERPGRATGPAAAAPAGDAGGRAEAEPAGEPRTAEEGAEPPGAEKGRGLPTNFFVMGFTGALGVLTAWMLVEALVEVRGVFINILVALFLAVGLNPIIEFLRRRGLPRWAAIVAVCAALVLGVTGFVWTLVPPLTVQVTEFANAVPDYVRQLQENRLMADLDRRFGLIDQLQSVLTSADFGQRVFGGVFGIGQAVLDSLVATFTVLVLTLFFMASLPGITETGYRLVPRSRRAGVRELGDEIIRRVGDFIGGQLLIAAIGGVVAFLYLTAIGFGYALTLALVVGVTALIPLVGTTIGALAAAAAVSFGDPVMGAVTLVFFLVYQQIESYVISPRIMQRSVDVAPTVTITSALIGGALLGLVGALLAVPAAAAVTLILQRVVFPRLDRA
ncbi:AI-2E family transporter [Nocardiopsis composta]|uniref:Putative PurR-regulated permease PerM n=2 Tax=Nocardiopsis composta TaxID=157465 RepID=A0A7W8QLJ2_9ACTN|nr:AI-2E family transporter [Nocardiopsis composta]MBB5431676.1 putative PurR-regulated permease PerM [Nocardiopsis composta]